MESSDDEMNEIDPLSFLYRKHRNMGTTEDPDWNWSALDKKREAMKKRKGSIFRSSGVKSRGSTKRLQLHPEPFPHQAQDDAPKGCGNPLCVIIDRKPMRFHSLCEFVNYLVLNNRKQQVNFIQKGDCYDIIDNKEGARDKPWVSEDEDLSDCTSTCEKNDFCKNPVTVNIDLKNILFGSSSAFGGPSFHESKEQKNGRSSN